tara:strand:+ start:646 stop:1095 length:450 start_codon:yes stop_codon:yes gene_type:complete
MIKKSLIIGVLAIMMSSCEKQEFEVRNYCYPTDVSDPTSTQVGAGIHMYEGETDEDLIRRIREFHYYDKDFSDTILFPHIFLSTVYYNNTDVSNPNPKYMLFPHSISSTSDKWGWEYYEEYKELGEQEFCNKYLNGERTLGMKLKQFTN